MLDEIFELMKRAECCFDSCIFITLMGNGVSGHLTIDDNDFEFATLQEAKQRLLDMFSM